MFFLLLLFAVVQRLTAQSVGIGTTTPDSSAILEINSSNKGLLLPRVNDTAAIKKPVKGLLVYNNNDNMPWYYDGNRWQKTIPDATIATEAIGMDSLWYKVQDTIAYTLHPYVLINTGLNILPPQANLQATGNLLIQPKVGYSNTSPTALQTYIMNNTPAQQTVQYEDSVFRIFDPGGTANYNNNMQGNVSIYMPVQGVGIKVNSVAAEFGLGIGDTLWIGYEAFPGCRTNYLYLLTNTSVNPADIVIAEASGDDINFIFRSNGDGSIGKGFHFIVSKLYNLESYKRIQTAGPSLYFNSSNGSFGVGTGSNPAAKHSIAMGTHTSATGISSFALGYNANASNIISIAMGYNAKSSGLSSTAIGFSPTASGDGSFSIGSNTLANGPGSIAMGSNTTASGARAIAFGWNTTASGSLSTAMGNYVSTNNLEGSFIIGDNSTTTILNSANTNNFRARFAGGYKLFTSANLTTGCTLFAGDNAWTTGSDVRTKENFAEINGEDFLKKISGFHLTSWNYKKQDSKTFRHYGPMAQDFYAAFGKDEYGTIGNDTTINSADFAGVSFVAIQALEKRTAEYKKEVDELKIENAVLRTMLLQLKKEVDGLHGIKKEKL